MPELARDLVLDRYQELDAKRVHTLTAEDVAPFHPIFEWLPSEATGLLCAAAAGARGTAEIRDQGFRLALGDHTANVHALAARRVVNASHSSLGLSIHHRSSHIEGYPTIIARIVALAVAGG